MSNGVLPGIGTFIFAEEGNSSSQNVQYMYIFLDSVNVLFLFPKIFVMYSLCIPKQFGLHFPTTEIINCRIVLIFINLPPNSQKKYLNKLSNMRPRNSVIPIFL